MRMAVVVPGMLCIGLDLRSDVNVKSIFEDCRGQGDVPPMAALWTCKSFGYTHRETTYFKFW